MQYTSDASSIESISLDSPTEYDPGMDFEDAYLVGMTQHEQHKKASKFILNFLMEEFIKDGPSHSLSLADLTVEYGWCIHEVAAAARHLEARGVISFDVREPTSESCLCETCQAQRIRVSFIYDFSVDLDCARKERRAEAKRLQRQTSRTLSPRLPASGFVYLIKCGPRFKIGITNDLQRRMDQLRGQSPYPLEIVHSVKGTNNSKKEADLHRQFASLRVHGEWFDLSADQVAEIIESLNEWQQKGGGE